MKRRRLSGVAAACAVVSLVAACGGGGGNASASSGGSDSASFTGSPLNIGIIAPEDTAVTNFPGDVGAARAAINALNAKGGLNGHKLNLIYCNDKGDPNQSQICARQMASSNVIATVGGGALNDKLIQPILAAAHIPMIGFNPYFVFSSPNVYLFSGGSFFGYQWLTAYDISHKMKVALVSADNATATGLRTTLNRVAQAAGGKFTSTTLVPSTASDMSSYVASAQQGNPDAVIIFLGQAQVAQFIIAAEQQGAPFQKYQTFGVLPSTTEAVSAGAAKLQAATPFPALSSSSSNATIKEFLADIKAEQGRGDAEAAPKNISDHAVAPWLGVNVLVKLMAGKSDITAASVTQALDSAKDVDLGGVIPAWTPTAPGPEGFTRVSNTSYYLVQFNADGTSTQVSSKPVALSDVVAGKG